MDMKPNEADILEEGGPALVRELSSRQLGIRFFPVVAFAVSCRRLEMEPADNPCESRRSPMDATCSVSADVRQSTGELSSNDGVLSQSVTRLELRRSARIEYSRPHTIEHENKGKEMSACLGQGAALENERPPHSDHRAWENVGALQDAKGSAPNAKDPNEQD
jgi:hypothetical protein